jgi:chorismate dehydratase
MMRIRLGSVGYLNARPCVVGLERHPRFEVRFDFPSRCAALLHEGAIDAGLIPSIEYLRNPRGEQYRVVPDVAIASRGPVASVALYTKRPIRDVRSIAMDTSSRTSVALTRVLCARAFEIDPAIEESGPDVPAMLERCDAALLIGDPALFLEAADVRLPAEAAHGQGHAAQIVTDRGGRSGVAADRPVEKIDLGEAWTQMTGLPFVYAFWAGRPDALSDEDVRALQEARDAGVRQPEEVAREYFSNPDAQAIGARYLRDNIWYRLGESERAGLETFYEYAAELGLVPESAGVRFY